MHTSHIKQLIENALDNTTALINSADNVHFAAIIISPAFSDKSKVQQHQLIYKILQSYIDSGEIHALQLKTYTPETWKTLQK